jgi:sugar lactone lactonase YvrE
MHKQTNPAPENILDASPRRHFASRLLGIGISALTLALAQAQTVPAAQIYRSNTVVAAINGNAGHIAANSAGDVFYDSQGDNVTYWLKRGTTTPVALITGLSGGRSVYVDASNNVYAADNYGGIIVEVPYVNGTYATGVTAGSIAGCTTLTPTTPCAQFGNGGATTSYYYQPTDLGTDGAGDWYVIDEYNQTNPAGANKFNAILKFVPSGSSYVATIVANNLPQTNNPQIAVDKAGNVYYADGDNEKLYSIPIGSATALNSTTDQRTATLISFPAITDPTGVTVDKFGNLFVTNANTPYAILEFPAVAGVPQIGSAPFTYDPTYSANGVAFDGLGDMFYTGYSGTATNINEATFKSFNLGSAAIGTPVSSTAITLTVQFNTAVTLSALTLSGSGSGFSYVPGTCAAGAYAAGSSCNFNVNYTPTAVGLQEGAVMLTGSGGTQVTAALLSGIGLGALQTNDPATVSAIGSGFQSPQAVAVDAARNAYIADSTLNTVTRYAPGATTGTAIGTGLSKPTGVALDNAGDVFIADSGNGRVVEVPNTGGTLNSSAQATIISGLGSTLGITVDAYGNLYVADTNNNQVLELSPINGISSASAESVVMNKTLFPYSVAPYALTTDSTGNLFIADITANTITEIQYYGKQSSTIGSGYLHPSGLATDASGSLYIADAGNYRLLKIPYEAPIYNTNDEYSVGPAFSIALGISVPYAVATDSLGNLYVVDNFNTRVELLNRSQGRLDLGASNVGQSTAQENINVGNAGNRNLTLGNPDYTTTANAAFTITAPAGNGCANSESLAPSITCVLQVVFKPTAVAAYTQTLTFANNAVDTPTIVTLTGQGANLAATTLTLTQTGSGNIAFGQTLQITATISSTTAGTPTGDVLFYVDGSFSQVLPVNGKTVTASFAGLTAGSHTIAASYTGDNTYAPSNTTLAITIARAPSTVSLTTTAAGLYPISGPSGSTFTFVAVITPSTSTIPTGSVTFTIGAQTLGTVNGLQKGAGNTYTASLTTTAITASGTLSVTYSGDVNYLPASTTAAIVISPGTFTLTPSATSITVKVGQSGSTTLQITSLSGFNAQTGIVLSCAGLPAYTTCAFDPNGFQLLGNNVLYPSGNGPINIMLTVFTGTTPTVPQPPVGALHPVAPLGGWRLGVPVLALLPFALMLRPRRSRKVRSALTLLSLLLFMVTGAMLGGCGSSLVGPTPPGTYNVTITATGGGATQTSALTLVVQ